MALPIGPASRPRRKPHDPRPDAPDLVQPAAAASAVTTPAPVAPVRPAQSHRPEPGRVTDRIPSEIIPRGMQLSPAVLGLSLTEFFELLYQDAVHPADVSVEEFFRMRDTGTWPEAFTAGDPRTLFAEELCRRGQFVPLTWHAEGLSFATCKAEADQDELARALDLIVRMPVTLFTVGAEQVEQGIRWLYRR